MKSVNRVTLIGNLGRDPEVRFTAQGKAVANFSLATTERWGEDEKKEHTEWHKIVAWGKLGEICGEYLHKGDPVYIEGKIRTREWTDKEGNKRESKEIQAFDMTMLREKNIAEIARKAVEETAKLPDDTPEDAPPNDPDQDVPF